MIISFTREALLIATPEQIAALNRIATGPTLAKIDVQAGGLDLPAGYLAFRQDCQDYQDHATSIYGGIDPEGSVST